jgi:hypothetical protein
VKHRKPITDEVLLLSTEGLRRALEAIKKRREKVDPANLRAVGQAYEHYDAALVARWDRYDDAIAAAEGDEPNPDRLVGLLRARKPLSDDDRVRLAAYFDLRTRRSRWPRRRKDAVSRAIAADHYDALADLVAEVGRTRGRALDATAHQTARLAKELLSLVGLARTLQTLGRALGKMHRKAGLYWPEEQPTKYAPRESVVDYACEVEGVEVEQEGDSVRKLLDNPKRIRP